MEWIDVGTYTQPERKAKAEKRWKRMNARSKTNKRTGEDPKYLAWIRTHPCIVCGTRLRIEAAHTGGRAYGRRAPDKKALPVCHWDHQESPTALHKGRGIFAAAHPHVDIPALVAKFNGIWELRQLNSGEAA